MSLQTRLTALAQAVGADIKALRSSAAVYRNARGTSTAVQNVTASTWVTMDPRVAGQAVIEPVGAFVENTDKTITVTDAGWYALSAVVSTNTNYDGVISLMLVGTSDVTLATGSGRGNAGRGAWVSVMTEAVKLAAGEIVSLRAIADAAGAVNLQVAHFSIARVGGPQGPKGDPGGVNVITTLDWNTAITPNFYRSVYDEMGLQQTDHGPGDTVNPPAQAGLVFVHENGQITQRVWDLSTGVAYTRFSLYGGGWTAWAADLIKPPVYTDVMAGTGGPGPKEGDEAYFQTPAMKVLGIMWKFRYDATPPAGKPNWVFAGGLPWFKNAGAGVAAAVGQVVPWGDLSFPVTLRGDYMLEVGARLYNTTSPYYGNAAAYLQQFRGGGAAIANQIVIDNWTAVSPGNGFSATPSLAQSVRADNLLSGDVIQGATGASGSNSMADARWVRITPIRVYM